MKFGKFSFLMALGAAFIAPALAADSQGPYPKLTVCDPAYYNTLKEKAMAEVQREIQVNNSVITKPASVLALSCFDNQLSQAALAGKAFSDGQTDNNFALTINQAIGSSFSTYYSANFSDPPSLAGIGFAAGTSMVTCDRLNQLWTSMKCALSNEINLWSLDSQRNLAHDGKDIRGEMCNAVAGTVDSIYLSGLASSSDLFETAVKSGDPTNYFNVARPNFCSYDPKSGSALGDGKVCMVYDSPGGPGKEQKCSDMNAIPTGLTVPYNNGNESQGGGIYWSYVCINPGCYFDMKANASKISLSDHPNPPAGLKCSPKPMN